MDQGGTTTKRDTLGARLHAAGVDQPTYAPIVDLATGRLIGWDARAPHHDGGDGDGLSVLSSLTTAGVPPEDGLVFVHVRADLIGDDRLLDHVERSPARIVVDVRGAEVDQLTGRGDALDCLAAAGVHLSVEDTSEAALAMIAQLQPSFLTLDAGLVRDLDREPTSRSVVAAYVAFAEHEGIHVIADGVERHEQADALRALGVSLARGPLFGGPSHDWRCPSPRLRRPPLSLDPLRSFRDRLAQMPDAAAIAELLAEELARIGGKAGVYYERDGLFRCAAQRGHGTVFDGIPVHEGILGQAFRTGELIRRADLEDGRLQVAHEVRAGERVVGVAAFVAGAQLELGAEERVRSLATAAGDRLAQLGPTRHHSVLRRLSRAMLELSLLEDLDAVHAGAPRLATAVGGLSSALLALPGTTGLDTRALLGPLASDLRRLSPETLQRILDHVGPASSLITVGAYGASSPELARLHDTGASTVAALPVRSHECGTGLLLLGDHARATLSIESREALELITGAIARTLDMVVVVDDLRTRATVDPLTGLGNLAAFQESLSSFGARRRGGWALAMADVDGLKAVNDTHGHLAGDLALRSLAGALDDVLRSDDRMFRIGGDEFAALLHDVDAAGAAEIGRRMSDAAAKVMADLGAGLSVGIAIPEQGESPADFIDRADKMLYEVKREARGSVRVAPPTEPAGGLTG